MDSPRKPLKSHKQAANSFVSPSTMEQGEAVPQHLHMKHGGHLRPGDFYLLAGKRQAILLAHSQAKTIPRDPEALKPSTFAVLDVRALHRLGAHPLRDLYEDVLFHPIADIVKASGLPWTQFGAYRQGWSAEAGACVPTVVVWAVPMDKPDPNVLQTALGLAAQLDSLLQQHALHDVHVEVAALYCPSQAYGASTTAFEIKGVSSMYDPVLPGNSIGVQNTTSCGTFSGFVRVQMPDLPKSATEATDSVTKGKGIGPEADVFGLTCHHVAASDRLDQFQRLRPMDNIVFSSPPAGDHQQHVKTLQKFIEDQTADVDQLETDKEQRLMIGKPWPEHFEHTLVSASEDRLRARNTLEHVQGRWTRDHHLGKVLLSSGITMPDVGESIQDWALLQLDAARVQQNGAEWRPAWIFSDYSVLVATICDANGVPRVPHPTRALLSDVQTCSEHDDSQLPSTSAIFAMIRKESPVYVVLRGRSTPFGIGLLHDVRDGVHTAYGPESDKRDIVSRELTAIDVGVRSIHNTYVFSRPGDSGAPVRTMDGRLVGFLLSSNPKDLMGKPTSHIAVAETVAANIRAATGADRVTFVGRDRALV